MCNVDFMKCLYEYSSALMLNNCKIIRYCDNWFLVDGSLSWKMVYTDSIIPFFVLSYAKE
jgi:hypothetical protein